MRATVKVGNEILTHLLFGNDELIIVGIKGWQGALNGYVEFELIGNRDLIGKEGAELNIKYKTEIRIIDRTIETIS